MSFFESSFELATKKIPFVIITLVEVLGSAPQDLGAKMIVTEQGLYSGTVGGGKVEAFAIDQAKQMLLQKNQSLSLKRVNLQKDIGMSCGGEVVFLFEPQIFGQWRIHVFGAGHVSQELVPLLSKLESVQVNCIDSRSEWLSRFPEGRGICCHQFEKMEDYVSGTKNTDTFILVSKGHDTDLPVIKEIFRHHGKVAFLGVIGSEVKALKLKKELQEFGASSEFIQNIHCPIGLPFGTNDPFEIAVSILGQLLQKRDSHFE